MQTQLRRASVQRMHSHCLVQIHEQIQLVDELMNSRRLLVHGMVRIDKTTVVDMADMAAAAV